MLDVDESMIFEFDEVECVMAASDNNLLQEGAIEEADVEDIEDDENDDYFDQTIENIGASFSQADVFVDSFRRTRDLGMDSLREDTVMNAMMGFDNDIEAIEDDDDDDILDEEDFGDYDEYED